MYVKEFVGVESNKLYNDSLGLFDDNVLRGRILAKFSYRTIRADLTPAEIAAFGQNVIDSQRPYLSAMFAYANNFAPEKQNSFTTEKAGTGNKTDTVSENTTNTGGVTVTGSATDTPNSTTAITKSAYNATESRPAESTTISGENTATTNSTKTNDLQSTRETSNTGENNYSETVTVSGVSGATDIALAFEKYIQPYDYLAREIINAVCELTWG